MRTRPVIVRRRDFHWFASCQLHGWLTWYATWQDAHDAAEMHAFHTHNLRRAS